MTARSASFAALTLPTLVEASAGTGKTHAITTYFVRTVLELGLEPAQILVVTYTKAATAELRSRTRDRVARAIDILHGARDDQDDVATVVSDAVRRLDAEEVDNRLRRALSQMDEAPILTIHGFCQKLLHDYPLFFGIDFDFDIAEDAVSVFYDLAIDFWTTELHDRPKWFLDALKAKRITPEFLGRLANLGTATGTELLGPSPAKLDSATIDRWQGKLQEAARLWEDSGTEVAEVLLDYNGLNRNRYPRASIENVWIPGLDEIFKGQSFVVPEWFEKLAQERIVVKRGFERPRHAFFEACERFTETHEALRAASDYAIFQFLRRFLERARTESRQRCYDQALLTYDDVLLRVYESLDEDIATAIQQDFPIALVDEFQDTDSIQYGIFKSIYGHHPAVYVGDPKQAIYAFRGADVFSYLSASGDVGDRRLALTTNRRSDPGLVRAVNTLFSSQPAPFVLDGIQMVEATAHHAARSSFCPSLEVLLLDESQAKSSPVEESVPPLVANEIGLLLSGDETIDGRPVAPNDIAVLCRTNRQALFVTEALRRLEIPTSLDGDSSVLGTEIADAIETVLEAALTPGNASAVRRALLTRLVGVTPYDLNTMTDESWSDWVTRFREWHQQWHQDGVIRFLEELLEETEAESRIARLATARRELTDLLHIEELLLRGERERNRDPVALMLWFRRLRQGSREDTFAAYEDLQQRPDAESDTVRVTTIHKSKGLEYGVVYCPFLWRDAALFDFEKRVVKYHDPDDENRRKVDLDSPDVETHLEISKRETLSEALRLLYVGITRAKYRCTLVWGPAKDWRRSALTYLLHGEDLPRKMDDVRMRTDVDRLVEASNGAIGWRRPSRESASAPERDAHRQVLAAREAKRTFSQSNRIASFTSLTGHHEKTAPRDPEAAQAPDSDALFSYLPGGARTGLLLHAVLERASFEDLDNGDTSELVERELRSFGYDASLTDRVMADIQAVSTTRLFAPGGPGLANIPRDRQLRELEFTMSAGRMGRDHELQRFLRGFIDLVFEWEGRWYVADYKSNSLSSYDAAAMTDAASRADYLLQVKLYALAAQRYLAQRIEGFEPEQHWGGAFLLFLRGMGGTKSPGVGVLHQSQSPEVLGELVDWLGGLS